MNHQQLVESVLDLDSDIRFATVCNMAGEMEVSAQREGIERFLSPAETERNMKNAASAWIHSRIPNFGKIGKGLYTLTVYEKLKRATIPMLDGFLLLVSFDSKGKQDKILDSTLKLVRG